MPSWHFRLNLSCQHYLCSTRTEITTIIIDALVSLGYFVYADDHFEKERQLKISNAK